MCEKNNGKENRRVKRIIILAAAVTVAAASLAGCGNFRAKSLGGTVHVSVEKGQKVIGASWKDGGSLWILTRKMKPGEEPEAYSYVERSNYGVIQGEVVITEAGL